MYFMSSYWNLRFKVVHFEVADSDIWIHAYIDWHGSVMTLFFEFRQVWPGVNWQWQRSGDFWRLLLPAIAGLSHKRKRLYLFVYHAWPLIGPSCACKHDARQNTWCMSSTQLHSDRLTRTSS
jgi:hypothetical protein